MENCPDTLSVLVARGRAQVGVAAAMTDWPKRMIEGIRPYALYHAGHTRANARGISGSVRAY